MAKMSKPSLFYCEAAMARKIAKKKATKAKANGTAVVDQAPKEPKPNYRKLYEALQHQIRDVHRMLDAAEAPQNCGTINGRMVEFAKDWYKRCDPQSATHPGITAKRMLQAVDAPLWPL
jgi:hypothetical protein